MPADETKISKEKHRATIMTENCKGIQKQIAAFNKWTTIVL